MANSSQQEEENHNRRDEIQDLLDEERKRHKTAGMTLKYTSGALLEEKPHTEDGGRIGQFVVDARPFMMPTSSKAAADDNSQHEGEFSSAMKNLLPNSSNQRKATGNRGGTQESYKVKEQADFVRN
jgi:hypothetical protein